MIGDHAESDVDLFLFRIVCRAAVSAAPVLSPTSDALALQSESSLRTLLSHDRKIERKISVS